MLVVIAVLIICHNLIVAHTLSVAVSLLIACDAVAVRICLVAVSLLDTGLRAITLTVSVIRSFAINDDAVDVGGDGDSGGGDRGAQKSVCRLEHNACTSWHCCGCVAKN